mmetsp:Transcript_16640/g.32812  ORF Transcript_16640/g.32812 Transcript_16640/m.32812 type:complete len:230 (+) Transcript_16640:176-865(+)
MDAISDKLQYTLSAAVGMCLGALTSLIVDAALFEIGESYVFGSIFGVCLMTIGGIILWRVKPLRGERLTRWRIMVCGFSLMVLASGFMCFVLNKHWIVSLTPGIKLPMYTMLGTSLCFALTFSIVDMLNNIVPCSRELLAQPLVQSSKQIYVILVASVVMGCLFGFSFGSIDVEDDQTRFHSRLDEDQAINTAIGAVVGALMGWANQYLRDRQLVASSPYVSFSMQECS